MSRLKSVLKNKYFIVTAFFIVWMAFFDPKDWSSIAEKQHKLKALNLSENNLKTAIIDTRNELNQLRTSAQTIEKYAREKYLMKKDNEDIFLINNVKQ
jgi:cell division protein FtsB